MFRKLSVFCFFLSAVSACVNYSNLPPNSLQVALEANLKSLDPAFCSDLYENQVVPNIYETLLQYAYLKRPIVVEPLLADGMPTVSKDGLTHTFKIKKGVKFQDSVAFPGGKGREVRAQDFVYSWKRVMNPQVGSEGTWIFDGHIAGLSEWREAIEKKTGKFEDPVAGFQTPDDYTVVIKLLHPYYQLDYVLSMSYAAVVAKEVVEHYGQEFLNHPVGTGPFQFESWTRGNRVLLKRNPTFHGEKYPSEGEASDEANGFLADKGKDLPFVDKVSFWEMPEEQPRWLNFMKGVFDWVKIPKDNFDGAIENGQLKPRLSERGIKLIKYPEFDITYTGFNMDDPILGKNLDLRRALSLAYDRKTSLQKFYNNRGVVAQSPIAPQIEGYDPDYRNPWTEYDVEKAKEYLAKAGYPGGKGLPTLELSMPSIPIDRQLAEYLAQQWAAIGVHININLNSWPQFQERLRTRKAQVFGAAWMSDYPDAQNMFQILYGKNASPGPNDSNWADPQFDKLYEDALKLPPGKARTEIYHKMRDIFADKLPWLPDIHRVGFTVYHAWVRNFKFNETSPGALKYIRVDTDVKKSTKAKL